MKLDKKTDLKTAPGRLQCGGINQIFHQIQLMHAEV